MGVGNVSAWAVMYRLTVWMSMGLLGLALPASAEVTERLTYQSYRAELKEGETVADALNSATPIRKWFGRRFHGHIAWQVQWTFSQETLPDGRCAMGPGQVVLTSDITLPELVGGDAENRARFVVYLAALRKHELGHHDIALAAARQIDEGMRALPPEASCEVLLARANGLGGEWLEQARMLEKAYDQQTQYGRTQGAWLPR